MKIYNVISIEINDGSEPNASVDSFSTMEKALNRFNEIKGGCTYDEECEEKYEEDNLYIVHDIDDPLYNYFEVSIKEGELK